MPVGMMFCTQIFYSIGKHRVVVSVGSVSSLKVAITFMYWIQMPALTMRYGPMI